MAGEDEVRDLAWLRRQFIVAIAADDELFELLVLKGGNALNLLYEVGERSSLDLDYSLEEDVDDAEALGSRLELALAHHLAGNGIVAFDWEFTTRPRNPRDGFDPTWGGYNAAFKVITKARLDELGGDLEEARRCAWGITEAGGAPKRFRIELSKFEYCAGAREHVVDGFDVRVYTLAMIAVEKLRALCQQMCEYGPRVNPTPRARDFYDIHAIVTEGGVNLSSPVNHELLRAVFDAKAVPLRLLSLLGEYREFHRADWPSVADTMPPDRETDFDVYVDFVLRVARELEPLWVEDAP